MSLSHSILRFVFLATLSIASLSATGTSSTTAIPDPDLLSGDGGGGLGNRHLRGGTIRRQEQQRRQLLHSFNPTVDFYWLALHHHHDPSPLPASHRQIQDSTPPTNNVHDDARRHSFVQQCTSFLLSSDIIHDGIISQIDFVDMLLHQCRLENLCNISGLKLNFGQLDVSLRKKFIRGICKPTTSGDGDGDGDYPPEESRFECIYKLYEMMREESIFGFDANVAGVDGLVKDMCYETYPGAVDFGFVSRTQAPTRFPTNSPSTELSSVPSTLPSTADTTLPPSSLPSTSMVSDSPSAAGLLRTSSPSVESTSSSFPSDMPSTQTAIGNGNGNNSSASDDDDSMSNGGIVGITSAAIFITIVFVAYMYRCPSSPSPEMKLSKDPNYFGHEPWGKSGASLPIPYMGLNCSVCSSSSSYRDYRFVNVFGPRGTPIPQFNPNTAGAVVIGSVTIRASSSISSGPFVNSGSHSTKSQSMFTRRKRSHRRHAAPESDSGVSSRDDVSSMSSRRSSYQRSFKHRASNHRRKMTSIRLESRDVDHGAQIPSLGSLKSSRTVPLSHRQRQQMERQLNNSDSLVSFGDWRAATLDMSEGRSFSEPADEAAILAHRKIVFNTLCESTQSLSDDNMTPPSSGCHSLPNLHLIPRAGSSDAGSSSILSESYFQDGSSLRQQKSVASSTKSNSTNPFVPWRSEGFISSRMSDSKQSSDSDAYSSKSNVPEMKKRFDLIRRPAKAIAKYKRRTSVKDWFSFRSNSRQYHHLHKQDGVVSALQEDLEVLSMHSYSSNVRLLPPCEEMERADLPNLVLGTFAAASMPIGQRVTLPQFFIATSSSDGVIGGVVAKSAGNTPDCAGASTNVLVNRAPEPVVVAHASDQPTIRTHTIKDISSLDVVVSMIDSNDSSSIDAYSRSDFESSTTTSPTKTVSDSSYSSPFTANTSQPILHGSFASVKEDANDSVLVSSNTVMEDCVNDASSFGGDDVNATFYESKPVARKLPGTEIMLGNKPPSLVCDNDGSATRVFNLVSNSRSESGNFLFPSDEEDDDVVVDRKGVGVKVVTSTAGQEQPPNLITPIEPSTFFAE